MSRWPLPYLLSQPWFCEFALRVFDQPLPPASRRETELIGELQSAFKDLPIKTNESGAESEQVWVDFVNTLRHLVLDGDPREFLRWSVTQVAIAEKNRPYLLYELNYLKNLQDWKVRWMEAIKETDTGHPIPLIYYPLTSPLLLHHAYGLANFEKHTGTRIDELEFIFEFGGGYGSMCRLVHKLGFSGKYVIFDLPSQSALQRFFLKSQNLSVHPTSESFVDANAGVITVTEIGQLQNLIRTSSKSAKSLFIATWSISETPLPFRNMLLDLVTEFTTYFIAYQSRFREVDNVVFFDQWKSRHASVNWIGVPLEQAPENFYLFGYHPKT